MADEGERAFHCLRAAVVAVDRRLRAGLPDTDISALGTLLTQLRVNVVPTQNTVPVPPEVVS